jgi:hypothetical protein
LTISPPGRLLAPGGRTIRQALLIGALTLSLSSVGSAQDGPNRIRNFDAVLTVHADGSLDVTEELTIRLAGESNEIVRDFSLRDDGARKGSTKLDVRILAVTDEDGQPLRTEEASAEGGWARRLRIWIPGAGNAARRISIRYRVAGATHSANTGRTFAGLEDMRWNVTGNVDVPIDSLRVRVVLPSGARPIRTTVYTGAGEFAARGATTGKNGNEVSFALPGGLPPHQGIAIEVGWPAGYLHPKPSTSLWHRLAPVLLWWPLLLPLIAFTVAYRVWDKTGRDPKEKSQVVRYEPVDGVSAAGLGKLVSGERESQMRLFTATLVDLAVRGFLRIEETTPNILLTLTKDVRAIAQSMLHGESGRIDYIIHFVRPRAEWKGLKWHEERLLEGLVNAASSVEGGGTKRDMVRVSMLWNKFYVSVPEITEAIEFELVSKGYYRTRPGSVKLKWALYASPALVGMLVSWFSGAFYDLAWWRLSDDPLANGRVPQSDDKFLLGILLSALILAGFGAIMPSRSVAGARAREAGLGFKEFLGRVDTMPSVELFERYLPYAIAFGVQDSWARAFENIYGKRPAWYSGPMGEFSPTTFGHRISDLCISAASSMSSRPSESRD